MYVCMYEKNQEFRFIQGFPLETMGSIKEILIHFAKSLLNTSWQSALWTKLTVNEFLQLATFTVSTSFLSPFENLGEGVKTSEKVIGVFRGYCLSGKERRSYIVHSDVDRRLFLLRFEKESVSIHLCGYSLSLFNTVT